ncbi:MULTISPECIES: superoxide dismutase family protein [unclassified Streptomyces]|uniref:superoxide dismutase family protein n=1 Tax=unclassified Streptomyces TaxID=2593676 RepID=UPI0022B63917|nr:MULTISPECIES: superoxide dismutase family protein [unclassified Streptomyces]MCZ7414043.1 superoxide dismutase family protein [Streptomyces sp. WMMC897]MCZ7431039.1 superoxide dismutase family protein [Streptomyces sp. WMMC1477]
MVTGPATAAMAAALAVLSTTGASPATKAAPHTQGVVQITRAAGFVAAEAHPGATAVTYAPDLVPEGAGVRVRQQLDDEGMTVALAVHGLEPDHTFGAHVHTRPCGPGPADAGPHYQHVVDPVQPSGDPAYANPWNEVWLDVTTGADGTGTSRSRKTWTFRPGEARSVTLHRHQTRSERGEAGFAGETVACFSVPFVPRAPVA